MDRDHGTAQERGRADAAEPPGQAGPPAGPGGGADAPGWRSAPPARPGLTTLERLLGIGAVWAGCALAWVILGGTLVQRSGTEGRLAEEVHALWGAPQEQRPPRASLVRAPPEPAPGPPTAPEVAAQAAAVGPLPAELVRSALAVELALEHRRRGLVWFPTYTVVFEGRYAFQAPAEVAGSLQLELPLDLERGHYDGLEVTDAEGLPVRTTVDRGAVRWERAVTAGERVEYRVRYRSRGTSTWSYAVARGQGEIRDFSLTVRADFPAVDFAPGSLAPTRHATTPEGWQGAWELGHLVSGAPVALVLPERLNPGPLAARITFFAPVCLLFFFFVVALLAEHRGHALHPMHWFFLGCAFFAFHLLFAYLVDHVDVTWSFAAAAAVSVALVVTYARWFVGWRFALVEMGLAQVVYLVLFSWTFFFQGYTGLTVTVGAILTLALMMQLTGKRRWGHGQPALPEPPPPGCVAPYRCGPPGTPPATPL